MYHTYYHKEITTKNDKCNEKKQASKANKATANDRTRAITLKKYHLQLTILARNSDKSLCNVHNCRFTQTQMQADYQMIHSLHIHVMP